VASIISGPMPSPLAMVTFCIVVFNFELIIVTV
jgi:hypothetical protein